MNYKLKFIFEAFICSTILSILIVKIMEFKSMWVFEFIEIGEPNKIILSIELFLTFIALWWFIRYTIDKIINFLKQFKNEIK